MIDLHSHILPGIDDGSESVEMSLQMLEQLHKQGVTEVVATPHFYATQDTPEAFLSRRKEAMEKLACRPETLPRIRLGAEITYFAGLSYCQELPQLQIEGTGLLLVEMPYGRWTTRMVKELVRISLELGLIPVIAHAERYRRRNQLKKFLPELIANGIYLQCNARSFLRFKHRRWVLAMIKKGYVRYLGTDAHNITSRPPRYDAAVVVISKKLGKDYLETFQKIE